MEKRVGYYAGTEIDGKWWRRYREDGLFLRGNGEFWCDEEALYFRRYLVDSIIRIPFERIDDIGHGSWHAGRWAMAPRIIKIGWLQNNRHLSSGFVLARNQEETLSLMGYFSEIVRDHRGNDD